ncbi:hypothetical protein LZG74_25705 [Dyadobacter sp. CY327]|uniref:hypothetical protein n=1 Tax=Dyadobacter sp. CY327 TaxID=2907301 RepID=UPI001F31EFBE|nr:hypothetical protein [Dyadobacter sp. CY327]MCE7073729.1 hypothetical protein [Dyadobacter sp. CY327]
MSNQQTIAGSTNAFPWLIMILMSSVTFVGILSELMPSGVMPQINSDLNISELQGGNLVGYYAIASAIFAIPLVSVTLKFNRKILILILLAGFAASNTRLVDEIELLGGIESALLLFGSGSLISVLLAIKYTDKHLRLLTTAMFALVIISMLVLLLFGKKTIVAHVAFFLWGISFGPLVTLLQAAVSRQVESGKDVATSVQSSAFNLSIMIATSAAGVLLGSYSPMSLTYFAIILAIPGMIISIFAKKALG